VAKGAGQNADRLGIAMVHPSGHYLQARTWDENIPDDLQGIRAGDAIKIVECDFFLALTGGPYNEPIDFRKIRVFLSWLRDVGYWIKVVTADLAMLSFDMLQRLREMGFIAENQSVDKTSQPYRVLRSAFNEGRLHLPWPPGLVTAEIRAALATHEIDFSKVREDALSRLLLYQELSGLEHDVDADKIDHRDTNPDGSKGSKDVADALCGAVFRCLTDEVAPGEQPSSSRPSAGQAVKNSYNRYLNRGRG
jgi:hypothetical protein